MDSGRKYLRKLLWVGDAGCESGFAKATHHILDVLRKYWDVSVLALNYRGDPHPYPYPLYPAASGGDAFGVRRLAGIAQQVLPDVVVVQNDVWNMPAYMAKLANIPTIGVLAVDGRNSRGRELNGLTLGIFWTQFGLNEARQGGYTGEGAVIPLGVDLNVYQPSDRVQSRLNRGLPPRIGKAFIVGNVNRNQPRKRLDLSIAYFAEWVRTKQISDAFLCLHVAPTGDVGYDCRQLAAYFGVANRLILFEPEVWHGIAEEQLAQTYSCFDVQINTGQGEGWGLTTMEGMACGIPQIHGNWAALGEWPTGASVQVECTTLACTPNNINAVGGIPDREQFIDALDQMYRDPEGRAEIAAAGQELVNRPEYRWEHIGERFAEEIQKALDKEITTGSRKTPELQDA